MLDMDEYNSARWKLVNSDHLPPVRLKLSSTIALEAAVYVSL